MVSYKKCDPQNDRENSWRVTMVKETLVQPDMRECSIAQEANDGKFV